MANHFTQAEIQVLSENPNVLYVSSSQIKFTPDFKQRAYEAYMQGIPVKETMRSNGIDPETLGDGRVYSFTHHLKNKAVEDFSFSDRRCNNGFKRNPPEQDPLYVRELEHRVAYLTQEVEFLKKSLAADMEARKLWESQHLHTSNSNS